MSSNFFQIVDSNLTKKQNESLYKKQTDGKGEAVVHDPVLFRSGSGTKIFFLVGVINSESFYRKIYRLIVEAVQEKIDVTFLYVYKYRFTPEELSELGTDLKFLLTMSRTDLTEYIPAGSKVIAPGAVVYAITKDTNIQSIGFNSLNHYCLDNGLPLTETSFYAPEIKSFVYPVESTFKWVRKSNKAVVEVEEGLFSVENVGYLKRDFYGEFFKHQVQSAVKDTRNAIRVPSLKVVDVPDPDTFLLENLGERKVAIDIETTGLDHWDADILCVTLAFDGKVGYHLDWGKTSPGALTSFLEGKYIIGANFKFDIRHLYAAGVRNLKIDFDTLNAGHCLNENRSNSLKSHAFYYTYHGGYDLPLEKYKLAHPECKTNYGRIPKKHLIPYAAMDAVETFKVHEEMVKELSNDPLLERYYYDQVIPQLNAFSEMEVEGVYIDWDKVREKEKVFLGYLEESEEKIHKLFEEEAKDRGIKYEKINLGSKPVLARLLEDLGWPEFSRGKSKQFITKKEHLEDWARLGYKAAEELIRWNQIRSLLSTFIGNEEECSGMWQYRAPDGKIYPTYSTMLAKTHRNRSSQPNMQNIPKNNEFSKDIRELFTLPEGYSCILGIDYDGLQLRIGAILSRDTVMKETFLSGDGDLHSRTAQGVLARHLTLEEFKEFLSSGYVDVNDRIKLPIGKEVEILRDGKKIKVLTEELVSGDDILNM